MTALRGELKFVMSTLPSRSEENCADLDGIATVQFASAVESYADLTYSCA